MTTPATICISNNFSSSESSIRYRATYDKRFRRINNKFGLFINVFRLDLFQYDFLFNFRSYLLQRNSFEMLGWYQNSVAIQRSNKTVFAMFIFHCDLCFSIWLQPRNLTRLSCNSETMGKLCGINKSHWKILFWLIRGISNHQSLVPSPNVFWLFILMDWLSYFWGLFVQKINQFESIDIIATLYIVANFVNGLSDNLIIVNIGFGIYFSCKNNSIILS